MRLVSVKLCNFRAYSKEITIPIDDLTVIVGQNDAGKSSILDALEIFFNEPRGLPEADDFHVGSQADSASIACEFTDLPSQLIIDEATPTNLSSEYMLNDRGNLEIKKVFTKGGSKVKVVAVAKHPQNAACKDLLTLTNAKLKDVAAKQGIDLANVDQRVNTQLRQAIWAACDDLELSDTEIELAKESAKAVWDKLKLQMPVFALFKSDRPSTDQDAEAQDPMKIAIKEAIAAQEDSLEDVRRRVADEVQGIANLTVEKIKEMNAELASQLNPRVDTKKWESMFTVSLTGDEDIPINKRGSGTRRLVLLNFFRAKAEQDSSSKGAGIIYAIEEPETSQHPNNQRMLIEAFEELVADRACQVLLTTHTPVLARRFSRDRLRIVSKANGSVAVKCGIDNKALRGIVDTLGILPDHDIKVFVGVEGKHDMSFLRGVSQTLHKVSPELPDLAQAEKDGKLVFIPCGGSSVELWVTRLKNLNIPEYHIFDRDKPPELDPHYKTVADEINGRDDAEAVHTGKRELENYIHVDVITAVYPDYAGQGAGFEDVPSLFAQAVHEHANTGTAWADLDDEKRKKKESNAKRRLNTEFVAAMTAEQISQVDADGDIRTWLTRIAEHLSV